MRVERACVDVRAIGERRSGVDAAHEAEHSALVDLIEAIPTTIPGVMANMRYIADGVMPGSMGRLGDDYVNPLLLNLAEALEKLGGDVMTEHTLITPRRNFLIRALGFTAAGAAFRLYLRTARRSASTIICGS